MVRAWSEESPSPSEKWQEENSRHFIIYFKKAPKDFIKNVEVEAERNYDEISDNLGYFRSQGWLSDDRAKIYIYDDNDDYLRNKNTYKWSHGVAEPKDKVIRSFPSAYGFFDSTLPHELGHIIFREIIGFNVRVPLWFEEGVAMYQEKAKRFGSHKTVQDAYHNHIFMSVLELSHIDLTTGTDVKVVNLFYAESASIVYYMINELGKQRFVSFCDHLKETRDFEKSLDMAYGRFHSLDDLNKAWIKYLNL